MLFGLTHQILKVISGGLVTLFVTNYVTKLNELDYSLINARQMIFLFAKFVVTQSTLVDGIRNCAFMNFRCSCTCLKIDRDSITIKVIDRRKLFAYQLT